MLKMFLILFLLLGLLCFAAVSCAETADLPEKLPVEYARPIDGGTVLQIEYPSKDYYGDQAEIMKPALVYLPAGYSEDVPCDVLTDCTIAFCENIKAAGYQPMIYQNKRTSLFKLDLPRLQDYPFWLAEYRPDPSFVYDFDMWQYSATGSVDGIKGEVDMDLSFYDYSLPGAPAIAAGEPADGTSPADTTDVTDGTGDTTGDTTAADTTTAAETAEDPAAAAP